jgi:hypothetical protein
VHDRGDRNLEPDRLHRRPEELAVLRALDCVQPGPDQLDPELVQHARLGELRGEVERRLAAHRRQERVGPLALEHAEDALRIERLQVGAIGEPRVGHDRRRVRVDDDRAEAVLAEHLECLRARVVELAGLPDHDRAAADQADGRDVAAPGH